MNIFEDQATLRYHQGYMSLWRGRLSEAERHFEWVIQHCPDSKLYGWAYFCLSELVWREINRSGRQAISYMETALNILPPEDLSDDHKFKAYYIIGAGYYLQSQDFFRKDELDDLKKAHNALIIALSVKSDDWRVSEMLANICRKLGRVEEADRHQQTYLDLARRAA